MEFHDVQNQIVLLPHFQSGKGTETSFVWIFAEELSVHRDSNTTRVKSQSNFENLLKLERKSSISFSILLDESKLKEVVRWKKALEIVILWTHSIRSFIELLRKTFWMENLTSMWKLWFSVFPTRNFRENDPFGLPPALAFITMMLPSLKGAGISLENLMFGSERVW